MFSLFKNKTPGLKIIDKIWMTQEAKWNGCIEEIKSNPETIFIAWFDQTLQQFEETLAQQNLSSTHIFSARQVGAHLQNKTFIFIEHYPLRSKEQSLFEQLNLSRVQIFSALDEPLFKRFGSDKIVQMMKQMGMKETAFIENPMITQAIVKAQEKIETKITIDQSCRSQDDWLTRNLAE